ncbi:NISCH protein, partial [Amia calva]|nr:NISCH protein [Amia calva]
MDYFQVYVIEVMVGDHQWTVKHRYSDFHDLHEKLTTDKKIDKNLLPPKKMIGKNSKSLVERRQKELEVYLQTLLVKFPVAAPKVLSCFLHFHLYEINGITATLAEELFHKGERLLVAGEVFLLRPLQLYAITQQLRLAKPTCANGDAKADLGHILDFTCRLKYLKIPGTRGTVGTSNIQEHILPFDLQVFKSLLQIEISHCDSQQIRGLPLLKHSLATMSVHYTASSMKDILVPEASEFAQWEAEGTTSDSPVSAIIPTWKTLTTLDMSHNQISCIDESVLGVFVFRLCLRSFKYDVFIHLKSFNKLIPKVEFLDLSHNELTLVENLQHLYNLIHLDLSYNNLAVLEGVHTKLGNIKTLNLAGNQLEGLSGLSKLYSLVNLDLSNNKLAQMDEIKNIGSLPCLEKLSLSNNPLSIIPDYRTKVLAQFWDRASEVCLDGIATTEKELDTVEVLKAIQKAKEAKDRMANNDKKISEDARPSTAGSKSNCSSFAARPSSPSLSASASSSQEIICTNTALVSNEISTRVDSTITQRCSNIQDPFCEETLQVLLPLDLFDLIFVLFSCCSCCYCAEDRSLWTDREITPVLPFSCMSYTTSNLDFTAQLSGLIGKALWEKNRKESKIDVDVGAVKESGSQSSGDGYFEMGLGDGESGSGCTAASDVMVEASEDVDDEIIRINRVFWLYCIQINKGIRQSPSCLVLTDSLLAMFQIHEELTASMQNFTDGLETDLIMPYTEIEAIVFDIPETCLSLKLKTTDIRWYFLSDSHSLKEISSIVSRFTSVLNSNSVLTNGNASQQDFVGYLLASQELEEGDTVVKGAFPAHLLDRTVVEFFNQHTQSIDADSVKNINDCPYSDMFSHMWQPETEKLLFCVPCVLFLTLRYLYVIKVDFAALARNSEHHKEASSFVKLTRIPLASVLLHPKQGCVSSSTLPAHRFSDGHVLELMTGYKFVTAVFALPHDKFLFLRVFSHLRSSLQDVKTVAFFRVKDCLGKTSGHQLTMSHKTMKTSTNVLFSVLFIKNKWPELINVENEELKHILWSSVVFYRSPDVEMTACIMLSTKALYFVLDDSASQLGDETLVWNWKPSDHEEIDFLISYLFTMKLNDLQSVNVGLFDQYFRVVGSSADQIISCLTRDSYGTHRFIQQLMTVLSLLEKLPSPEPLEKDFYTEFGNKSTGKMENYELVHSSRVKFIYPSEEEIGDLTYVVAEKMGEPGNQHSFNILLYVLAFQVQHCASTEPQSKHLLQPKTLILTSSDIFLFDEDYISYPLPDFAKEPPQRDKYRLADARRIRDLDRVLMGYQTYPQALTFVFDDLQSPDVLCNLTMDHFASELSSLENKRTNCGNDREVQWCIFVPGADSREKLISLLARQWEVLCSRELPVELTG